MLLRPLLPSTSLLAAVDYFKHCPLRQRSTKVNIKKTPHTKECRELFFCLLNHFDASLDETGEGFAFEEAVLQEGKVD